MAPKGSVVKSTGNIHCTSNCTKIYVFCPCFCIQFSHDHPGRLFALFIKIQLKLSLQPAVSIVRVVSVANKVSNHVALGANVVTVTITKTD